MKLSTEVMEAIESHILEYGFTKTFNTFEAGSVFAQYVLGSYLAHYFNFHNFGVY